MKYIVSFILITAGLAMIQACDVRPEPVTPPTLDAVSATDIAVSSATLSSAISHSGNQDVLEHGFVYSETNATPTVDDSKTTHGAIDPVTPTPITFSKRIEGLKMNTTYQVRSYATVAGGPAYGPVMTFKTLNIVQPGIRTDGADAITVNSARLSGTVTTQGTNPVSEYGICWSSSNTTPTTADSKASQTGNVSAYPSSFTLSATSLVPNTQYNYRAYVIAGGVTSYGVTMNFRTLTVVQPQIVTDAATNITINSARLNGTIRTAGSYPVSEYGVCWSLNSNPTTSDSKSSVSSAVSSYPSSFGVNAGGLNISTTYNYRAYVISNGVTTYGANMTFRTSDVVNPGISTGGNSSITVTSARLDGTLVSGGSYPITEYGVCWSTGSNPTTGNSKAQRFGNVTSFPSGFTVDASGLTPNTQYYYRAYVIANGSVFYGDNQTFRTPPVVNASVSTVGVAYQSSTVFRFTGRIDSGGSFGVTEYGIVYSTTSSTPTTSSIKLSRSGNPGSFPHTYTIDQGGIQAGFIYYYRAYAISNGVTVYGAVNVISTGKD